jgi:hypothetical protein
MSEVTQAIESTLHKIQTAAGEVYGAQIYTSEQVADILYALLKVTEPVGSTPKVSVTNIVSEDQIKELINEIEDAISTNVDMMDDSDLIDEDSLDISLSCGGYTINNVDVRRDDIAASAAEGIHKLVREWVADVYLTALSN